MIYKFRYETENERNDLINAHNDKYLIEEQNIAEGNFLIFTDVKPIEIEVEELKQENTLLKARSQALTDKTDFHEDVLEEIILTMHS